LQFPYSHKVISESGTDRIAGEFSSLIKPNDVIVINGNLGAGKTYFIKSALRSFGINSVSSPTFSLVNEYYGNFKYYHFDFYRINEVRELYDIGFDDYMKDEEAVKFIEWGNLFPSVLPRKRYEIDILLNEDFTRDFYIKKL
jgi:tRNA threonylcarbamoyladenosine biosynthesis protein TsaE